MKEKVISHVCGVLLVLSTGLYAMAADKVVVIPMGGGGAGSPDGWTDDGNEVRLTNSNDTVWVGANGTGKLHVEADPVTISPGYSTTMHGVYGTAEIYGVVGEGLISDGVKGTAVTHGVTGYASTNVGVYGQAQDTAIFGLSFNDKGVYGYAVGDYGGYFYAGSGDAIYSEGNIVIPVGSNVVRPGGAFKAFTIDHPLDPETKVLRHFSTEGPEALVIYSGTALLDASGEAVVQLPDYFDALARDSRTQLTARNESMPGLFAGEVEGNSLFIGGGAPDGNVYWQVTAERDDPKARLERIARPVEDDKGGPGLPSEGSYISPDAYLE